jgi:Peptidase M15/Putative peptidoglycan binding domain
MSTRSVQQALRDIGWPVQVDGVFGPRTRAAVRDFQRGYTFEALGSSGRAGPRTRAALRACVAGGGRCSEHFRFREFRSNGDGWITVDRALVRGLERYRRLLGKPVPIVSGYRDPAHNAAVGGARTSQHLFGNAADIPPALPPAVVRDLRAFSGIGVDGATGLVRHVDVRHRGPNPTGGTVANPTVFVE